MYYFAYGSNLSHEQMKKRCPGSTFAEGALLKGYKRVFDGGDSKIWKSCTANLLPSKTGEVWGALYRVSDGDMNNLDAIEGGEEYFPEKVTVRTITGTVFQAKLYRSQSHNICFPGSEYLAVMEQGIRDCQLNDYKKLIISSS
jgi:gamma-glutamylcyclotransferase (GGCT)/AIG2-like uncharacterized protein YtfP